MEIDMADWRRQKIGNLTRAINSHKAKIARLQESLKIFQEERDALLAELGEAKTQRKSPDRSPETGNS